MGGLWTKETETRLLMDHLDQDVHLRLFINSIVPARGTALTSLVTIASGTMGYAPILLPVNSWVVSSADPACLASQPTQVWTMLGSHGPVFGYYYTAANSESYPMGGVERFSDGPYSIIRTGQQLSVTPVLGARGVSSWA